MGLTGNLYLGWNMSGTSRLDFLTVTGQLTGGTEAPSRHFLPIGNSFWATRSGWDVIMVTANYRGVTWGGGGVALSILIEMYLNQFFWHQNGPTVIHISATRARPYVLKVGVSLEVPISREELRQWGGGSLKTSWLTDSCGRMSDVRHPCRPVCTHSIYKCHGRPTWSYKSFSDGLLQTYNSP